MRFADALAAVIIPQAPFGDPKMDNGERWDLKAKYTDEGYEDADSDVMVRQPGRFYSGSTVHVLTCGTCACLQGKFMALFKGKK